MREFDPTFAAELPAVRSRPFWSVCIHFPAGDFWIAGVRNNAGGIDHAVLMLELQPIGATTGRTEPLQLDVAGTDLTFVNIPKHAGMPGPLATGERFIDRWIRTLESVNADVYLNYETAPGTYFRELLFSAVCSTPATASYRTGTLHLASRTERYLNAAALRKFPAILFPFAHQEDQSATCPIVIGAVPKAIGRVLKGSSVSDPVADPNNSSSAQLLRPEVSHSANIETWTVEFTGTETAEYLTAPNAWTDLSLATNTGSTEPVAAQSFTIAAAQTLRRIQVRHSADGGTSGQGYLTPWYALRLEVWGDSGGNPNGADVKFKWSGVVAPYWSGHPNGSFRDFFLQNIAVALAAGTYWIVQFGGQSGSHTVSWTDSWTANKLRWGRNTGGGYAGGKAKKGTRARHSPYGNGTDFWHDSIGTVTWDATLDAQDFFFALDFGANDFALTGTTSGADGNGTPLVDFVSNSKAVRISTDKWQGTPAAGDKFTFFSDPSPSLIVFSESPAATPVKSIMAVYVGDQKVFTGTTVQFDAQSAGGGWHNWWTPTSTVFQLLGYDASATGYTIDGVDRHAMLEWVGIYYPIYITGTQTFRAVAWQVFHSLPFGDTQSNPLRFGIYPDYKKGRGSTYPVPDRTRPLRMVEVSNADVSQTVSTNFTEAAIEAITISDSWIWIAAETDQYDPNDFYEFRVVDSAGAETGVLKNHAGANYVFNKTNGFRPGYKLIGATIITNVSADDGTGNLTAQATMDFDIAEALKVTADIGGISDDSSGTYTGNAGSVLTTPPDVFHWLLNRAGVPDTDIDLDGLTTTRGFLSPLYHFDGVIQDDKTWKALLLQLAYECRCAFDWVWKATLKILNAAYEGAATTVTLLDIVQDSERVPVLQVERSADTELLNSITLNYNRVSATQDYRSAVSRSVPDSITTFGVREKPDLGKLDFVRSADMARDIADVLLGRLAYPFWRLAFTTLLEFLKYQKDDSLLVDLTNAAEGGDTLGGWDGTQPFQVEGMTYHPELPGIDFLLREANLDVTITEGDGYETVNMIVVLRDQTTSVLYDYAMGAAPIGTWTTPSVDGGTVYNAILLTGGWYLYIDNGVRKWTNSSTITPAFTWVGPPAAAIDGSGHLVIEH